MNKRVIVKEPHNNWAADMIKTFDSENLAEDRLQYAWFGDDDDKHYVFKLGCDSYDDSIEIHVSGFADSAEAEAFAREKLDIECIQDICNAGCSQFWVNFHRNEELSDPKHTEVHCTYSKNKGITGAYLTKFSVEGNGALTPKYITLISDIPKQL